MSSESILGDDQGSKVPTKKKMQDDEDQQQTEQEIKAKQQEKRKKQQERKKDAALKKASKVNYDDLAKKNKIGQAGNKIKVQDFNQKYKHLSKDKKNQMLSQMQQMAISQDLFDDPSVKILPDVQELVADQDHSEFAARIVKTLRAKSKNILHLPGFIISLLKKSTEDMDSQEVSSILNVLTAIYNEKNKSQKGKQKGKTKGKPALKAGKATASRIQADADDFLGSDDDQFQGKVSDDDDQGFM